jgi:hypothetical protein
MQAVALVTGDEFLVPLNLTIDTENVLELIESLSYHIYGEFDDYTESYFDDFYGIDFAPILAPSGYCYNFNMIEAKDLYHNM